MSHAIPDPHAGPFRTPWSPAVDDESWTVPYDGQRRMRLAINSGLSCAQLRVDPEARDLVSIDPGEGPGPRIRVSPGEVALRSVSAVGDWLRTVFAGVHRNTAIVLHPAVEWTISVRGGLSRFDADLADGVLARIEISGGCSDVRLDLPHPTAAVPIRISGGASKLHLRRPAEVGVTIAVSGGISAMRLDDRPFGSIGGGARLETGSVVGGAPRYELQIGGGASDVSVGRR